MKICWDNLEGLRYMRKSGQFVNLISNCRYVYIEKCPGCGEPFLAQIYYTKGVKQTTSHCGNACRAALFSWKTLPKNQYLPNETWKPIKRHPGYYVSDLGRVSGKYGKLLKPGIDTAGYKCVGLSSNNKAKTRLVHLLVTETFMGKRPHGKETHHKNTIKTDPRLTNLTYVSHATNIQTSKKLTPQQVLQIRKEFESGKKRAAIAKDYNICLRNVFHIARRDIWRNI